MKYDPRIHKRRSIRLSGYDYSSAGAYFVTLCTQNRACLFGDIVDGEMVLNEAGRMVERWYGELENKYPDIQNDAFVCMPNHVHFIVVNVGANLRVRPDRGVDRDQDIRPDRGVDRDQDIRPDRGVGHDRDGGPVVNVGANLRVRPDPDVGHDRDGGPVVNVGANLRVRPDRGVDRDQDIRPDPDVGHDRGERTGGEHIGGEHIGGEHTGSPLRAVIQWFKTMTTNEYIRAVKQRGWQPFPGKLWQRNYWEHIIRNESEANRIREYIRNNPAQWSLDRLNSESV